MGRPLPPHQSNRKRPPDDVREALRCKNWRTATTSAYPPYAAPRAPAHHSGAQHRTRLGPMSQYRTLGECGYDMSMQGRLDQSLEALLRNEPLYQRIGKASSFLLPLNEYRFPKELSDEATVLFSVFDYVRHYGDRYPDYSSIPLNLSRKWIKAFLRVYQLVKMAEGAALMLNHPSEATRIDKALL
jgi:hypothetical protein